MPRIRCGPRKRLSLTKMNVRRRGTSRLFKGIIVMVHHHERRYRAVRGMSMGAGSVVRLAGISVAVTALTLSSTVPAVAATPFSVSIPTATPSAQERVAITVTSPDATDPDETADAVAPVKTTATAKPTTAPSTSPNDEPTSTTEPTAEPAPADPPAPQTTATEEPVVEVPVEEAPVEEAPVEEIPAEVPVVVTPPVVVVPSETPTPTPTPSPTETATSTPTPTPTPTPTVTAGADVGTGSITLASTGIPRHNQLALGALTIAVVMLLALGGWVFALRMRGRTAAAPTRVPRQAKAVESPKRGRRALPK
ncbi:MAG: hypothetical protein JWQ43_1872 [Glaciihabitans sp.]|nr:hypothetical protein [Glaciihabitans sp.]